MMNFFHVLPVDRSGDRERARRMAGDDVYHIHRVIAWLLPSPVPFADTMRSNLFSVC